MEYQLDEQMSPLSAEQIAINEKKINMTLDDLIKLSRKTASNPRKPRAYSNKRKNGSTAGGKNLSNVRASRVSKPNKRQKYPTAGALLRDSPSVWSRLTVSKPSVKKQGLATRRYVNQDNIRIIIRAPQDTTRARPLIRSKMPNLSYSRAGITPLHKRSIPEKKQYEMKKQKQGYSAREFDSLCNYVSDLRI